MTYLCRPFRYPRVSRALRVLLASGLAHLFVGGELIKPVCAQLSGDVERRFQDQQLREELRQLQRQQERLDQEPLFQAPAPTPIRKKDGAGSEGGALLRGVELRGAEALPASVRGQIEKAWIGQPITPALLNRLRQALASAYEQQRLLALVASPKQLPNGFVVVEVLEAKLGAVEVDSNASAIRSGWAIAMVQSALKPGSVIRLDKLESALIKLNDLAGLKATATMRPGRAAGLSNVALTLEDRKRWNTLLNVNNELSQYTGVVQLEGLSSGASLLGRGDLWSLNYALGGDETGYGVRRLLGAVDVPVTADGMRFLGSLGWSDYRLLQELASDELKGSFRSFNAGLRQPLWRRPRRSIFAQLGYDQYRGQDWVLGEEYSNRVNHAARGTA